MTSDPTPVNGLSPLGAEIKRFRKIHNLTQKDFAALIHSTLRTVQDWEADIAPMHPGLWELANLKIAR